VVDRVALRKVILDSLVFLLFYNHSTNDPYSLIYHLTDRQ